MAAPNGDQNDRVMVVMPQRVEKTVSAARRIPFCEEAGCSSGLIVAWDAPTEEREDRLSMVARDCTALVGAGERRQKSAETKT